MANRRMIASDTWRDEFIGSLDLFGRLLWIGLITTCADDQGRILNNPRLIRSDIFPFDDFTTDQINSTLDYIVEAGKLYAYEDDGKRLLQIVNWWEYQTPSWASPSRYPAPQRWTDRSKYHAAGNKIEGSNWDMQGGFAQLHSAQDSILPSGIEEGDVKSESDVKSDVKSEDEVEDDTADNPLIPYEKVFTQETKLPILSGGPKRWFEGLDAVYKAGATPDDFREAIREQIAAVKNGKTYNLNSPASYVNATLNILAKRSAQEPAKGQSLADAIMNYKG